MDPLPGQIVAGKFRLERPLAQGGMGSVWIAHNQQLDVPVALKFMAAASVGSTELVVRFEREAKAAAQLRHPNVVQVFEHGVFEGLPYIAMELLEGESLSARLKARGRLSLKETSRVLGEVCLALRRAHERGLVHRDLKPANIFLARHDDLEVAKILDFGIAKSLVRSANDEVTKSGAVFGSPHYMSPEQARPSSQQVDHRTDLWALGAIAFRCLTGEHPFPGDDVLDVLMSVCADAPPAPSSIAPDLGPEVDQFMARALAHDPDDRFQSARELAEALAGLADQPAPKSTAEIEIPPASAPARPVAGAPERPVPGSPAAAIAGDGSPGDTSPTAQTGQLGTLTGAATAEIAPPGPHRRQAWVISVVLVAGVVALGVAAAAVLLSRSAANKAAPAAESAGTAASVESPTAGPAPSTSVAVTPSPGSVAVAAPSRSVAVVSASAKPKGTSNPAGAGSPTATAAPGATGSSGYLGKPKF